MTNLTRNWEQNMTEANHGSISSADIGVAWIALISIFVLGLVLG